jgi:hypothetical protein
MRKIRAIVSIATVVAMLVYLLFNKTAMSNSTPKYLLLTDEGGVGKTSIPCATVVETTDVGKVVLLNKLIIVLISSFILLSSINVKAQEGPFLKFSLGPGVLYEHSTINESGFTYAAKNHAIGWGFNHKYAVYFSEFGASTRKNIEAKFQFINLDAYGLGFSCNTENNISFHAAGGYGTVHFSDCWKKQGDFIQDGYAMAIGVDKKWGLSKRIYLGVGPLLCFFKTTNYSFTNFSVNCSLNFFLFPQQQPNKGRHGRNKIG